MLAINEISSARLPWDMRQMGRANRKQEAEDDALRIARKLARIRPADYSEAQWCKDAGVSQSFFSNLRGRPTIGPSNPSVFQLREILKAVGVTLSEFFAGEARGVVAVVPTKQDLERALREALPGRPRQEDRLPGFLADTVLEILALPRALPSAAESQDEAPAPEEDAPPRDATKRA